MHRTVMFATCLLVFPVLLLAGGCGSPQAKEPSKSPPPAAAEAATTATPEGLKELSAEDREAAQKQRTCPVSGELLGEMGKPYKITVEGRTVFLCCPSCEQQFRKDPQKYFAKMKP